MSGPTACGRPTVLVTGAAGRLGSSVAALLYRQGYTVAATDIVDAGDVPYRFQQADLLDHQADARVARGGRRVTADR